MKVLFKIKVIVTYSLKEYRHIPCTREPYTFWKGRDTSTGQTVLLSGLRLIVNLVFTMNVDDLKGIKRRIICNRGLKEEYIRQGMIGNLLAVLKEENKDEELLSTAAQTIGSLCSIPEGVTELHAVNGVRILLDVLERDSKWVVGRQLLWTLKLVAKSGAASLGNDLSANTKAMTALLEQLQSDAPSDVLNVLGILNSCVLDSEQCAIAIAKVCDGVMLTSLLESSNKSIVLQSLVLLQNMLRKTDAAHLFNTGAMIRILRSKLRQPGDTGLHLAASECIVLIAGLTSHNIPQYEADMLATLIDLISLLDKNCVDAIRPLHLLTLGYPKLGSTVIDLDAVPKLIRCLEHENVEYVIETLHFIRDLSNDNEQARRQCIDAGVLPMVCSRLNSPDIEVQLAGCKCLHVLSRSVKTLKVHIPAASGMLDTVMNVAKNSNNPDLSVHTTAVLANLCSEPNNLREALLEKGVLEYFINAFRSAESSIELKCTALLGVTSLAYVSTRDIKQRISAMITGDNVKDLLWYYQVDNSLMENTLILIRNMSHNFGPASSPLRDHWDLDLILSRCLDIARTDPSRTSIVIQCLYIAVNVASGRKQEKDSVIESGWHEMIPVFLQSQHDEIREASMWLLQNLISTPHFLPMLRELHVDMLLESMDSDPSLYIRDRANIVLEELKKASGDFSFRRRSRSNSRALTDPSLHVAGEASPDYSLW